MLPTTVIEWVDSVVEPFPIRAVESSVHSSSISGLLANHPVLLGTEVEAMLWVRLGMIDRAHEIVQDASRGTPAYIHGIIHRLEGDYWNANYWFGRVQGSQVFEDVKSNCEGLEPGKAFSPTKFTDAVEKWFQIEGRSVKKGLSHKNPSIDHSEESSSFRRLSNIGLGEWKAVWQVVCDHS